MKLHELHRQQRLDAQAEAAAAERMMRRRSLGLLAMQRAAAFGPVSFNSGDPSCEMCGRPIDPDAVRGEPFCFVCRQPLEVSA